MTETTTEDLARFAASVKYENIPASAREYCKDILLDTLAYAFAGHFGEETDQIARFAKSLATSTESTVIGGDNLSLAGATLLNGYLITAVTMCDIHRSTLTHVTPEVVPPALLIGERDNVSGRDLLVALAAGFEVTTRVGVDRIIRRCASAAITVQAFSDRSARPRRQVGYAVFRPKPWRAPSAWLAVRPAAPLRRGARRR